MRRVHGVTLMELLVVLTIVSVLLGLSFAGLQAWKRRSASETCLAEVALRLREARNFAVSGSVESVVDVDTDRSTLTAYGYVPVALVSFDRESGEASLRNVAIEPGRLGNGGNLKGGEIVFTNAGALVGPNGAALRFCLCPLSAPPERGAPWTLVAAGQWIELQATSDLALAVRLGSWTGTTRGRMVTPGRWHDVVLQWRRGGGADEITLQIDSVQAKLTGPERTAAQQPSADIFASGIKLGPAGVLVDEIELLAFVESREYGIPAEFVLVGPRARVYFGPSGGLDLRRHDAPVAITIADAEELDAAMGKARTVVKSAIEAPVRGSARVWVEMSGRIWSERLQPIGAEAPPESAASAQKDATDAEKAQAEKSKAEKSKPGKAKAGGTAPKEAAHAQ